MKKLLLCVLCFSQIFSKDTYDGTKSFCRGDLYYIAQELLKNNQLTSDDRTKLLELEAMLYECVKNPEKFLYMRQHDQKTQVQLKWYLSYQDRTR